MGSLNFTKEQAVEEATRQYQHRLLTIQQGFNHGKKRTCPGCGVTFLTRKDKRIHRKATSGRCVPSEQTFRYA